MSKSTELTDARRKILTERLYKCFQCRNCKSHMEEVMMKYLCRKCFTKFSPKLVKKTNYTDKPLVMATEMAKQARLLMNLTIPSDFEVLFKSLKPLGNQSTGMCLVKPVQRRRHFQPHVLDYLKGLSIIMIYPFTSFKQSEMDYIQRNLEDLGASVYGRDCDKSRFTKRILLADHAFNSPHTRPELDKFAREFQCPVVDIQDFLRSIQTGRCEAVFSQMSVSQTPLNQCLMWENIYKPEFPPIVKFESYKFKDPLGPP